MRSKRRRYVYIIKSGDFAKIGSSVDPVKRLMQLERNMPIAPWLVARFDAFSGLEQRLHTYLADSHVRYEWFRWCEKLDQIVSAGLPACISDIPPGSPIYPNRGGRKRMVEAAQ